MHSSIRFLWISAIFLWQHISIHFFRNLIFFFKLRCHFGVLLGSSCPGRAACNCWQATYRRSVGHAPTLKESGLMRSFMKPKFRRCWIHFIKDVKVNVCINVLSDKMWQMGRFNFGVRQTAYLLQVRSLAAGASIWKWPGRLNWCGWKVEQTTS